MKGLVAWLWALASTPPQRMHSRALIHKLGGRMAGWLGTHCHGFLRGTSQVVTGIPSLPQFADCCSASRLRSVAITQLLDEVGYVTERFRG